MASWRRVFVFAGKAWWSPRPPRSPPRYGGVAPGVFASVVAAGAIGYYRYRADNRTLPISVYADGQKVSRHQNKSADIGDSLDDLSLTLKCALK